MKLIYLCTWLGEMQKFTVYTVYTVQRVQLLSLNFLVVVRTRNTHGIDLSLHVWRGERMQKFNKKRMTHTTQPIQPSSMNPQNSPSTCTYLAKTMSLFWAIKTKDDRFWCKMGQRLQCEFSDLLSQWKEAAVEDFC